MRVLVVDTNSVRAAEQTKAAALAGLGHRVTLLAPTSFKENYRRIAAHRPQDHLPQEPPYKLILGAMAGKPPNRSVFLSGLTKALAARPQAVLALADENFWLTAQVLAWQRVLCPGALFLCHSWQNLDFDRANFPQPVRALYDLDTWLERRVFRRADAIMARNREAMGVLRRRGYHGRLAHIPWGVDAEGFAPEPKARPRPLTIGYVGRLLADKGLEELLAASGMMKAPHRLLIVGAGPMQEELAAAAKSGDHDIRLLPVVPHEKMPELYNQMDILVLPSRTGRLWKEQFGRVLAEAMLSQVAVAGSDSGAIPDVVGDTGLIFPEGDAGALAAALDRLAQDGLRAKLALAGRQRALKLYSWQAWARATSGLLGELAAERGIRE